MYCVQKNGELQHWRCDWKVEITIQARIEDVQGKE